MLIAAACATATVPVLAGRARANEPPEADAGFDQHVDVGETVSLDASASSDPDGDPLDYEWALLSAPSGSNALILSDTSEFATLQPDLAGVYEIELTVSDGDLEDTDDVNVIAEDAGGTPGATPTPDGGGNDGMPNGGAYGDHGCQCSLGAPKATDLPPVRSRAGAAAVAMALAAVCAFRRIRNAESGVS